MKKCTTLLTFLLCAALLAACGSTPASDEAPAASSSAAPSATASAPAEEETELGAEGVTLQFWGYDGAPEYEELFQKYIDEFEANHPGVTIEYLGLPFEEAKSKFDVAIATGTFPDIAFIGSSWTSAFAMAGGLAELDGYYDAWEGKDNTIAQFFDTGILFDKRYAVPCDATVYGTWYRPDWYKEAGLHAPATFDEFFSNIEALNDPASGRYGFTIRGGGGGSHQMEGFLLSYAGAESYFDADGQCYIRDPLALEGLKRYVALYNNATPESDVNNGYREMAAVFDSGTASTMCHNISSYPLHESTLGEGKYALFVLPEADNGNRTVAFCGVAATSHLVVSSTTPHTDLAWEFTSYLLSDGPHSDWVQNLALFPVTQSVSEEDWLNGIQSLTEVRSVLDEPDTHFITAPFHLPDFEDIHMNQLQPGLQEMMLGRTTPEDFAEMYATAMEEALAQYDEMMKG